MLNQCDAIPARPRSPSVAVRQRQTSTQLFTAVGPGQQLQPSGFPEAAEQKISALLGRWSRLRLLAKHQRPQLQLTVGPNPL